MAQDEEKKPFTVKDRRRFDASGNRRQEEAEQAAPTQKEPPSTVRGQPSRPAQPPRPAQAPRAPEPSHEASSRRAEAEAKYEASSRLSEAEAKYEEEVGGLEGQGGPLNFAEFVLSIATNAIIHLGGDTRDGRMPSRVNLPLAAQHIDIIAMLKEKTNGNLDRDETELLDALLYDLRMKYVAVAQAQGQIR